MEIKVYNFEGKRITKFNYMLSLPEKYSKENSYPLLIALHGAGERGDNPELIFNHGVAKCVKAGRRIPAIVVAPQCPLPYVWNQLTVELKDFVDSIIEEYSVDKTRISITGLSMGGYGTWEMGMCYPELFSAIAPVCGGGMSWRAEALKNVPVRAFHGDADTVVPPTASYEMCDALKRAGGDVLLTVYHGIAHNSWDLAYETTDIIDWLITRVKR